MILTLILFLSSSVGFAEETDLDLQSTCEISYKFNAQQQKACKNYCASTYGNRNKKTYISKSFTRKKRIQACQLGQSIYLKTQQGLAPGERFKLADLNEECTEQYSVDQRLVQACIRGIRAEDQRKNPRKKGPGTSGDVERETGHLTEE